MSRLMSAKTRSCTQPVSTAMVSRSSSSSSRAASARLISEAVYWSRSRKRLWHKGEESGHIQKVHAIRLDCDNDVVLLRVTQIGHEPGIACHTGRHSCFFQKYENGAWVAVDPVLKDPEHIYK